MKKVPLLTVMEYNSLVSSIPRVLHKTSSQNPDHHYIDPKYRRYMASKSPVQLVYNDVCPASEKLGKLQEKLHVEIDDEIPLDECVNRIKQTTRISKYRSFQYRLIMRAVITNRHLCWWKIRDSDQCTFCGEAEETYRHLFYECICVQSLWKTLTTFCEKHGLDKPSVTYRNVYINQVVENAKSATNFLCLVLKQYIYRQKCLNEPVSKDQLTRMFYQNQNIEKYHAMRNSKTTEYIKRWKGLTEQYADIDSANRTELLNQVNAIA